MIILLTIFAILGTNAAIENMGEEWDINWPCKGYVKNLSLALKNMVSCAAENSTPPRVCISCCDPYIELKKAEYLVKNLHDVFSFDGKPCSTVIYANYPVSYIDQISTSLTTKIWDKSRCDYCLDIHWDLPNQNTTVLMNDRTLLFHKYLSEWQDCVRTQTNLTDICKNCGNSFNQVFDYYWVIYKNPDIDFCLDVESTMNDTMNLWHNVWNCPDDPRPVDRKHDVAVVAFSTTILVIVIALFYAGSYIQTENAQRNLVQYSRLEVQPRGARSRLISTSTTDTQLIPSTSTPTSSRGRI